RLLAAYPFIARVAGFAGALMLVGTSTALATGTLARNREYSSALTLARTVLARRPSGIAHQMMGTELTGVGNREEGVKHLREAIRAGAPRAHYALGLELFTEGKLNDAIDELQAFVREEPLLL